MKIFSCVCRDINFNIFCFFLQGQFLLQSCHSNHLKRFLDIFVVFLMILSHLIMNFIAPTPHFSKNYLKLFYSIKQTYGALSDMNSVFCLFIYCLVAPLISTTSVKKQKQTYERRISIKIKIVAKRQSEETHGVSIHQSIAPQCDCFDTGLLSYIELITHV